MKNAIGVIMKNNGILSKEDAEAAIEFVRDLLDLKIDYTKKEEPYATNWLERAYVCQDMLSELPDFLDEGLK